MFHFDDMVSNVVIVHHIVSFQNFLPSMITMKLHNFLFGENYKYCNNIAENCHYVGKQHDNNNNMITIFCKKKYVYSPVLGNKGKIFTIW